MSQATINANLTKIKELTAEKIRLEKLATEWGNQAKVPCDYRLKGRQEDCLKDRETKSIKAQERKAAATAIGGQIAALELENKNLYEQAVAEREVEVFLAKSGTTAEAEAIKATAEAETP